MNVDRNRIKFSLKEFDKKTFNEEKIILPIQFVDRSQNGQWSLLMGTDYKIRGYSAQDSNGKKIFVVGFKNKAGIVIQQVMDMNDLLQLYLIFGSIRDGFGTVYKVGDRSTDFELEARKNGHGEFIIQIFKDAYSFNIVSDELVMFKEVLYLLHWLIMNEPAELNYIDGQDHRPLASLSIGEVIRGLRRSNYDDPVDFLENDQLRDYLGQFGLEIREIATRKRRTETKEEEQQQQEQTSNEN